MFKKLINRYKAKQEHKQRTQGYILNFNREIEQRKTINKSILLHNLIEASGINQDDIQGICNLDKAIEDGVKHGLLTEFYTRRY